ncbi:MAG TPA: hypothetical protein VLD57_01205 [Blastocatellia bacterium]|nr:hypothetical protein [Blastocatellia bacterium]
MKGGIKLLFLGQCLNYGYSGVERRSTFPELAVSMLRTRFPGLSIKYDNKYFYHPSGLKSLLKHRLLLAKPDIVVIGLPAMFAATPWRVSLLYELAPEVVDSARDFMQKIGARLGSTKGGPIGRKPLPWDLTTVKQALGIEEYERLVQEGVEVCRSTGSCRVVLMGPGRFNEDTTENYEIHSPELWASVNEMIHRIGRRTSAAVIDAQQALSEYGGEVFLPGNHRFSNYGHEVVAREVESVLAAQLASLRPDQS